MTARTEPEADSPVSVPTFAFSGFVKRVRGFWEYYRRYTNTAIHAAATAALTAFGLLIFIDASFAWLAIASYLLPPIVLYAIGSDAEDDRPAIERSDDADRPVRGRTTVASGFGTDTDIDADSDGSDADEDHDDPDRDVDGIDRDSDSDSDGVDADRAG